MANEPRAQDDNPESRTDPAETGAADAPAVRKERRGSALRILARVCSWLTVSAAVVVLTVSFAFPVMRIYGSSMSSTLVDGDIVIAKKTTHLEQGDICAFNYGSRILVKRVIGLSGDVIDISTDGTVYVNGAVLDEPYLKSKGLGDCDIEFPFTVPEESYFVLGDNRRSSLDSRNAVIGCVSYEQLVGKLLFCVLPIPSFGRIK